MNEILVDQYSATLHANGTLVEEYVYEVRVSGKYTMLYRIWEAPLVFEDLNTPFIKLVSIQVPEDTIAYVKDYRGVVWATQPYNENPSIVSNIDWLAELNEAGCYNPNHFQAGRYVVRYLFEIHPPVQYDNSTVHFNLKLAGTHVPYNRVTIIIKETDYVLSLYPHPPTMNMIETGSRIEVHGSAAEDELLELEILLKKDVLSILKAFSTRMDDVTTPTVMANNLYSTQYYSALALKYGTQILVFAYPLLFILIYFLYGREQEFTVPSYLSFVPNKDRKPWVVNLVFKGDAIDFDENGFYATLLDLHLKGKITISEAQGELVINIIDENYGDSYERSVISFLKSLAENGALSTRTIGEKVENLNSSKKYSSLLSLQNSLNKLTHWVDRRVTRIFIVEGRQRPSILLIPIAIVFLASIILGSIVPMVSHITWAAALTCPISFIQTLVAIAMPTTLFGRWKDPYYREKLEWDAFKKFLSDLTLIRRYAPQDISMWGEWLVYDTALGVGDKVAEAMRELRIPLEELNIVQTMPVIFIPITSWSPPSGRG
ncbi:MAG: DUF2207 family protein, partial [Thermoproteota archaeon]